MKFLQLIRYKNLLLLALMQLIFRFGYLEIPFDDFKLIGKSMGILNI